MSTTKFKYLDEKLGLGATKSFFPFYDNEKDKDFKVRLDILVDLIAGQVTSVGKSVFELSGITNSGNNYSSSYTLASYITEGIYIFQPNVNSSGNAFLNVSSLGSLPIKKFDGTSLINVDDLKAVNTYLLINKTTYWLLAGGVSGGSGGVSTFSALTDSPYDNILLASALNSKQDRINGIVSGCVITVETFIGVGTNKRIRVTDGTWYITPSEYTKATDTVSSEITLCVTGGDFKYYDIVADDSGAITIYEGTPSTAPAHYVINPLTEVLLGFITVGDAVIEEPSVISDSLEKKFEGIDLVTGSFTLDCESKDFPAFFIRLNGTAATLDFSNYWNVVEGTIYIAADSTTVLNLPTGSKTGGVPVTAKTFDGIGRYRVTFGYLYGEYYFNFDTIYQAVGSYLTTSNNLSDLASAQTARVNIGIDKRTTFGNANYTALITDREIVTSVAFTAPRTVTLIDGLNAGAEVIVADEFQTVTSTNTLTIQAPSGKKLNGVLNGTEVIRVAGSWRRFFCDGAGNYIFDADIARLSYVDTQDKKINFKLSFNGVRVIEDYWIDGGTISTSTLSAGILLLEYSTNNEATYSSTFPVTIPANTRVFWRCTYATNAFTGSANLKGSFTNTI